MSPSAAGSRSSRDKGSRAGHGKVLCRSPGSKAGRGEVLLLGMLSEEPFHNILRLSDRSVGGRQTCRPSASLGASSQT